MPEKTKIVQTNTFQIKADARFTEAQTKHESFSIWNINEAHVIQFPIINMAISLQSDLDEEFEGDDYQTKVYEYFSIKRQNQRVSNKKTVTIAGKEAFLQRSFSIAKRGEKTAEVFHLFVNIPLEDGYMQEFSADCEVTVRDIYEPLFMQAIESIEWLGDIKKYIDIQEEAYNEQMARIDAILAKTKHGESDYENLLKERQEEQQQTEANYAAILPFEIPKDGKNHFKIGTWDFTFDEEESYINVTEFSKQFVVELVAHATDFETAKAAQLLDSYPGEGEVKISFLVTNIYNQGVPTAVFSIEEDKCKTTYINLSKDGFEFSLAFFGTITMQDGWLGLNGFFKPKYSESPVFPVTIYKQIDINNIDWQPYHFSFEEALQIAPEVVHYLRVNIAEMEAFPQEIFGFKNLKGLSIFAEGNKYGNNPKRSKISEIPEAIGSLSHLESLLISDTNLSQLPESITNLKLLTSLNLQNNPLKSLPATLLQLPLLINCRLTNNLLEHLPEEIDLPNIHYISLENNRLTSLPEKLTQQAKLKNIEAKGNPMVSLPDVYNSFSGLNLSLDDKKRLLNYEYQGADGKGTIAWDDTVFYAEHDAHLLAQINKVIAEKELEKHATILRSLVKKAVGFKHTQKEDYATLGNTRFGGMPDLPPSIDYPRFGDNWRDDKTDYIYEFIAQLNCADIAHLQDYLPKTGMLYFFLETIHSVYGGYSPTTVKVLFYDGDAPLISGSQLTFSEDDYSEMSGDCYQGFKVDAFTMCSTPYFYGIYSNGYILKDAPEAFSSDEDLLEQLDEAFEIPLSEQTSAEHQMNNYPFTQNESPELQASLKLKGNPEDWIVLLTVSSSGDFGWGDAGDLFYVIHKSDLAKQDFSQVFCTMESS